MDVGSASVPFAERAGRVRGVLDILTGCYPSFLFGGSIGQQLPVFHLHEVTPADLEPLLVYLVENGYTTVTADAVSAYVTRRQSLGPRTVVLTFDDAWASLWTVALPFLRRYGLQAIAFAIPTRIVDAPAVRPTLDAGIANAGAEDTSDTPFVTWPELKALHASGVVDVQSHALTHAAIYCSERPVDFITPAFAKEPILLRPLVSAAGDAPRFLDESDLGAPLYVRRSRLSDARRFLVRPEVLAQASAFVTARGGARFFARPNWRRELEAALPDRHGDFETEAAQHQAIEEELDQSRALLDARLGAGSVRHLALPWGISGSATQRALRRGGYETAFAEHLFRPHIVRPGGDPYWLGRLNVKLLRCLPGQGRRNFFSMV